MTRKRYRTADQALVRRLNSSLILNALRIAPQTRASLAARTGLNRSTVSSLIDYLIAEHLVREGEIQPSRGGRPGTLLELNPEAGCAVGVEINVDYIAVLVTDFAARPLWDRWTPITDTDRDAILALAINLAEQAIAFGSACGLHTLGIGLGVPGLVDMHTGMLKFAPNLQWQEVPLRQMWEDRFKVPVFVDNEANAAAMGEWYFGAAAGASDFIYLTISIGIGGGIVLNGRLLRGSGGYAGEVGHMAINPDGPRCACGKQGCWEMLAGMRPLLEQVRRRVEQGEASSISALTNGNPARITLDVILTAAAEGDRLACSALAEAGQQLGLGIASLINIFNPQLVVLGGEMSQAADYLMPDLEATVRQHTLQASSDTVTIRVSSLGAKACVRGAIALVLDEILRAPAWQRA